MKNLLRKSLATVLTLSMLITCMPLTAIADNTEPAETAVIQNTAEPTMVCFEEPTIEPEVEAIEEPVVEPEVEATEEPVVEPEVAATEEPVVEPEVEAREEPVVEPEVGATEEPVVEPEVEATEEPVVEPEVEATEEPVVEPEVEATEEPVVEPEVDSIEKVVSDIIAESKPTIFNMPVIRDMPMLKESVSYEPEYKVYGASGSATNTIEFTNYVDDDWVITGEEVYVEWESGNSATTQYKVNVKLLDGEPDYGNDLEAGTSLIEAEKVQKDNYIEFVVPEDALHDSYIKIHVQGLDSKGNQTEVGAALYLVVYEGEVSYADDYILFKKDYVAAPGEKVKVEWYLECGSSIGKKGKYEVTVKNDMTGEIIATKTTTNTYYTVTCPDTDTHAAVMIIVDAIPSNDLIIEGASTIISVRADMSAPTGNAASMPVINFTPIIDYEPVPGWGSFGEDTIHLRAEIDDFKGHEIVEAGFMINENNTGWKGYCAYNVKNSSWYKGAWETERPYEMKPNVVAKFCAYAITSEGKYVYSTTWSQAQEDCQHSNHANDTYLTSEYQTSTVEGNHQRRDVYTHSCTDCGEPLPNVYTEWADEQHTYTDGVCVCGAIETTCDHANENWRDEYDANKTPVYTDMGDGIQHRVQVWYNRYCADCGGFVKALTDEGTFKEHDFSNGATCVCGYECPHTNATAYYDSSIKPVFENITETHHDVRDGYQMICDDCKQPTGETGYFDAKTEKHDFSSGDICICEYDCNNCNHTSSGEGKYVRTHYKSVDAESHVPCADTYEYQCDNCPKTFEQTFDRAGEQQPEKHSWDKDGKCQSYECGYVCAHDWQKGNIIDGTGEWLYIDETNHQCVSVEYEQSCSICGMKGSVREEVDYEPQKHLVKWVSYDYKSIDEKTHKKYGTKGCFWSADGKTHYCKTVDGKRYTYAAEETQSHNMGSDGKCKDCGYAKQVDEWYTVYYKHNSSDDKVPAKNGIITVDRAVHKYIVIYAGKHHPSDNGSPYYYKFSNPNVLTSETNKSYTINVANIGTTTVEIWNKNTKKMVASVEVKVIDTKEYDVTITFQYRDDFEITQVPSEIRNTAERFVADCEFMAGAAGTAFNMVGDVLEELSEGDAEKLAKLQAEFVRLYWEELCKVALRQFGINVTAKIPYYGNVRVSGRSQIMDAVEKDLSEIKNNAIDAIMDVILDPLNPIYKCSNGNGFVVDTGDTGYINIADVTVNGKKVKPWDSNSPYSFRIVGSNYIMSIGEHEKKLVVGDEAGEVLLELLLDGVAIAQFKITTANFSDAASNSNKMSRVLHYLGTSAPEYVFAYVQLAAVEYAYWCMLTKGNTDSDILADEFAKAGFWQDKDGIYHTGTKMCANCKEPWHGGKTCRCGSSEYIASTDCWQMYCGYTDLYDEVFNIATDMERLKLRFFSNGIEYILWAWKGDYLNLGAGAELGVYEKTPDNNSSFYKINTAISMPMTLKLYYDGKLIIDYAPTERQWWITGFNPHPEYYDCDVKKLTAVYTVEFADTELYDAFYRQWRIAPYQGVECDSNTMTVTITF
ncbi:MAG: DUF4474 domain-containing protein [Clostridiales bacterium]|nr:DUF4474 domain-containing protein [Clostridiales bacterium]